MINYILNSTILIFFFILITNLFVFYLLNLIFIKKGILIDIKKASLHKQLINHDAVPVSGGIILILNCLFFELFSDKINYLLIFAIFLIGLFADIQKLKSPLKRFVFQSLIVLFFVTFNDIFIKSIRISFLDIYLNYNLISIIFTSFCLLILINGSNFIDGVNLQCSGYFLIVFVILSYLNLNIISVNNINIIYILYPFLLSFIIFNFFNKSYLGDSGSYLLSFITGYLLINFQIKTNISPYFIVLVLWYPSFENFFSILRKIMKSNITPDQPDLLHLHHLLFKFLNSKFNLGKNLSSSMPSIIINLFNLIIFYIGSHFLYSTFALLILIFICIMIYIVLYFLLFRITSQKF